jgi:protoporphyrinogen oxidase
MAIKVKYLILGAGPSGLSLAAELLKRGESSFLLIEKESEVGGLCRSKVVDGAPLDIGGGHFLDVRRKKVLEFVFEFLPASEWERFHRISKIRTADFEIDYPYEANIWQLPVDDQIKHLMSIANAGSNRESPMPKKFKDWITWKLGDVIADNYMLPYNSKIFADVDLNELGTYWLYKLPDVSFEDVLRSCFYKKPQGKLPAHVEFFYPRAYGYGEVFRRIGEFIGNKILLDTPVETLDIDTLTVNNELQSQMIINTIPWHEIKGGKTIPLQIRRYIDQLKYNSIDIVYRHENHPTDSHWTYFPEEALPYHRILYRHNFISGAPGYWEEVNSRRIASNELNQVHHNPYAYPINTIGKPKVVENLLAWAKSRSILGLGRWGEWEHMNSDVAMEKGINLAEALVP